MTRVSRQSWSRAAAGRWRVGPPRVVDVVGDVLHVSLDREILERGLLPFDEVQYMGQVAIFAALRERSTGGIFILSTTCVCSPSSNAAALS